MHRIVVHCCLYAFRTSISNLAKILNSVDYLRFERMVAYKQMNSFPMRVPWVTSFNLRSIRCYSSNVPSELESIIQGRVAASRQRLARLKLNHGDAVFDKVAVKSILGGMRGVRLLLCETSHVDPIVGISYRGRPIQQLLSTLPHADNSPPYTEGLFWLLLTGDIPTPIQVDILRQELSNRMKIPEHAINAINALPIEAHPMTQFVIGITACQTQSTFSKHYTAGTIRKEDYWKSVLDDGLSLVAQLPQIASLIYNRSFRHKTSRISLKETDSNLDWAANAAHMMGFEDLTVRDVFRLYAFLHADHEGGNVSAHAAHLVASALSDPFLSFAASMAGLAGPLHGLANQDCLEFLRKMLDYFKKRQLPINSHSVKCYITDEMLSKGRVVPGFGHAVLRAIDPRFLIQRKFAIEHIKGNELNELLGICTDVVPEVLGSIGKVSNPYPNVDAHSGVLLSHFGMKEERFYTVLFGLSRSIGIVAQLVWDRALGLPIERPKSVTLEDLEKVE